jgi:hypothetical protein
MDGAQLSVIFILSLSPSPSGMNSLGFETLALFLVLLMNGWVTLTRAANLSESQFFSVEWVDFEDWGRQLGKRVWYRVGAHWTYYSLCLAVSVFSHQLFVPDSDTRQHSLPSYFSCAYWGGGEIPEHRLTYHQAGGLSPLLIGPQADKEQKNSPDVLIW